MKEGAVDGEDFRRVMDLVYGGKKPKKHASPTKRLIQQKDSAWKHKEFLVNNNVNYLKRNEYDQYSLAYVCDPKKTFVIQPKDGEINYAMHEKKPEKFYETVMKQKVTEHKVSNQKTYTG